MKKQLHIIYFVICLILMFAEPSETNLLKWTIWDLIIIGNLMNAVRLIKKHN